MPGSKKRNILFVDYDPQILQGLQWMLNSMRNKWEMKFVEGGAAALSLLQNEPIDIVVTDMRMPGIDGIQLLSEIKQQFSEVVRIALSGYFDKQMIMMSVSLAHQFYAKPCDPQTLISAISRVCSISDLLGDQTLKKLVTQISSLPSLPVLYVQLQQVIQDEDSSFNLVAEIISKDMGMTAKVLQLANSAFFGLPRKINSPKEAILFIGLKTLEALILSVHIFDQFKNASRFASFLNNLWLHSQATAGIARAICQREGTDRSEACYAAMAGFLHDCGKLVLADNFPDKYDQALFLSEQDRIPLYQAEEKIFGAHHGSVGGYLLGIWGLPDQMIEAVSYHHQPHFSPLDYFDVLTAVHAANALEQKEVALEEKGNKSVVNKSYLLKLGMLNRLPDWQTMVKEFKGKGATLG